MIFSQAVRSLSWRLTYTSLLLLCCLWGTACRSTRKAAKAPAAQLLAQQDKGWLRYQVYRQPGLDWPLLGFSIRVINLADNTSPLRRISPDLEAYNIQYEYLLNRSKEELYLLAGSSICYPVAYSFENNYNVFPFETINMAYRLARRPKRGQPLQLVFADRVFAQDTLVFTINHLK